MSDPANLRASGAVDLGGLGQPPPATPPGGAVIDVSEATFQAEVVERSRQVPVVLDFWAAWCGPCRQLSPILEKLAAESGGRWALAKIDVDANQRLSAAAGVQGIPAVKAVVDGQIVGEFTGAMPEAQVRDWINQLLTLAEQGAPAPPADAPESDAAPDPLDVAYDALAAGDLDRAEAGLRAVLETAPGDPAAKAGLAQVTLLRRAQAYDESALQRAVDADPDDVPAQTALADVDVLSGAAGDAFDRLLALIRRTDGDAREAAKTRLLELLDALDPGDPTVLKARRDLASALF